MAEPGDMPSPPEPRPRSPGGDRVRDGWSWVRRGLLALLFALGCWLAWALLAGSASAAEPSTCPAPVAGVPTATDPNAADPGTVTQQVADGTPDGCRSTVPDTTVDRPAPSISGEPTEPTTSADPTATDPAPAPDPLVLPPPDPAPDPGPAPDPAPAPAPAPDPAPAPAPDPAPTLVTDPAPDPAPATDVPSTPVPAPDPLPSSDGTPSTASTTDPTAVAAPAGALPPVLLEPLLMALAPPVPTPVVVAVGRTASVCRSGCLGAAAHLTQAGSPVAAAAPTGAMKRPGTPPSHPGQPAHIPLPDTVPALSLSGASPGGGFGGGHSCQRQLLIGALPAGFAPASLAGDPRMATTDATPPDAPVSDRSARPD